MSLESVIYPSILPLNVLDTFWLDVRRYYVPSRMALAAQLLWTEIEKWRRQERWQRQVRLIFEQGDVAQ